MAANRTHTCVFFDDGDLELLCLCGTRGLQVLDADGETVVVAILDEDATVMTFSAPDASLAALAATA